MKTFKKKKKYKLVYNNTKKKKKINKLFKQKPRAMCLNTAGCGAEFFFYIYEYKSFRREFSSCAFFLNRFCSALF